MIPPALLNSKLIIKRRREVSRDSLNNPVYGQPTSGSGWYTVYKDMPARLAFSTKGIRFAPEGERIQPIGTMYFNKPYELRNEDRVLTPDGYEYVVIGVSKGYTFGAVLDHYEATLQLP